MAAARLAVFPTRQNLQVMKVKLTGAKKGHSLLKKKADALTMRLRALLKNILQAKEDMGAAFREGNFALAEVKYAAGDVNVMVKESVTSASVSGWRPNPARAHATPWGAPCSLARSPCGPPSVLAEDLFSVLPSSPRGPSPAAALSPALALVAPSQRRVEIRVDNIAGVKVPVFKAIEVSDGKEGLVLTGLSKGGQQITKARSTFAKAVDVLVQLATLQTSFMILDEAIKVTSRRVNALDTVVIPKIANTVEYIKSELDELEREEFFRLKRSQDKKKKDMLARKKESMAKEAELAAKESAKGAPSNDLLAVGGARDSDVVF